jgi:hypothetical protein
LCFSIDVTLFRRVDALDLVSVVNLRVDAALLAVAQIPDLLRRSEIDATRQLTDDQDIEPFDHVALERGGFGERRIADRRTQIGEELQVLAQAQKSGFRAHLIGHLVPFGPADGPEHHRIGVLRQRHGRIGHGLTMGVVSRAADQILLDLGTQPARVEPGDDALELGRDLGPDAVTGQKKQFQRHEI